LAQHAPATRFYSHLKHSFSTVFFLLLLSLIPIYRLFLKIKQQKFLQITKVFNNRNLVFVEYLGIHVIEIMIYYNIETI
jgi:hypothetical protein